MGTVNVTSKFEIRSTKSETNRIQQIQNSENPKPSSEETMFKICVFRSFEIVSNFGFRYSNLSFVFLTLGLLEKRKDLDGFIAPS